MSKTDMGLGLWPEHITPEPVTKGYFGHEDGCDCAVCENMHFRELHLKRKAADLEEVKRLAYQAGFDAAMSPDFDPVKERDAAYDLGYKDAIKALMAEKPNHDVQFWKNETHRAIETGDVAYAKAYKRIAALELCLDNFIAWLDTFPYENSVTTVHKIREQLVKP